MIDREKVIKGLEHCSEDGCIDCPYEQDCTMCEDTLELLKEQEQRINVLNRAIEQMPKPTKLLDVYRDGYAKVVRCKDCKNAEILPWLDNAIICKKHSYTGVRPDNFYCADGERQDGDG